MEFLILGPLTALLDGDPVGLGGPRQQTVVAMLLLEPQTVIPVDRLIDAVWDDEPPLTAREQIQICVSNLRRVFSARVGSSLIETRNPGYVLGLRGCTLDSLTFDSRVRQARVALAAGDSAGAAAEFRSALSLWRGAALSSVTSSLVQHGVTYLNEKRLTALEECLETELNAGLSPDVVGELVALTREHPLRERFRALLMTALYRSGRQAEALDAYRATRAAFMDELGIEPGANLKQLHQAILKGEPVSAARPRTSAPVAPAAGAVAAPPHTIPNLLPATIPDFTGRAALIEQVEADIAAASRSGLALPVTVLFGQGGAGKTTAAVHLAHRMAPNFPDGQLFAQLRPGARVAEPFDVLGRFLRAMGVDPSAMPQDLEERAEVYRDLLAKRRMLIVLDNAQSEEQISLLLPGSAQCSVIVTGRIRLAGLPAANRVEIGTFSESSAASLLTNVLGAQRVAAEPEAVARLCEMCGRLPLALRIVAARLTARPHWPVSALVDRLVDESARLNELKHGELAMRASITMSYDALTPEAQRLFRLLAVSEAPSFAAWVGAPLLETNPLHAEDLLEELTEAYLLSTEPAPAGEPTRYRFHDIMRPFAQELLMESDSTAQQQAALERLLGAMLYLATEAHRREYSGDYVFPGSDASVWRLPEVLTDRILESPLSWYEHERLSLLAGVRQAAAAGLVEHSWGLALSAVTLFESHSYYSDWRTTHETALKAACRHGDTRGEAVMRYSLGSLYLFQRDANLALRQFEQAGKLFEQLGDEHGGALVLRHIAFLDRQNGDLDLALSRWEDALGTLQVVGDRIAEAYVLQNMAQIRLDRGEEEEAHTLLARAERICRETGNRRVSAQVRNRLGGLYFQRGELDRSAEMYEHVLEAVRASGDRAGECHALLGLAAVYLERGEPRRAEQILCSALELAEAIADPVLTHRVLLALAEAELARGELKDAARHGETAARGFNLLGAVQLHARALMVRGRVHHAAGQPGEARRAWQAALRLLADRQPGNSVTLRAQIEGLLAALPR